MIKTNIHVWHDSKGEIFAVGRPISEGKVVPLCDKDHFVLEIEVDDDLIGRLHQTHVVDPHKRALVKRPGSP